MINPILSEMVAKEQQSDRLRQAEQRRLANAGSTRQPTARFNLRISFGNLVIAVRQLFKAPVRAE